MQKNKNNKGGGLIEWKWQMFSKISEKGIEWVDYGEKTNELLNEKISKMILEKNDIHSIIDIKDTVTGYKVDLKLMY